MWRLSFVDLVGLVGLTGLAGCTFKTVPLDPDAPEVDAAVLPDVLTVTACPSGYGAINGIGMYRVVGTTKKTWSDAAGDCNDDTATDGPYSGFTHLIVLGNEPERLALKGADPAIPVNTWIGLSDSVTEGMYLWVTAESTGTYPMPGMEPPWGGGQPDNGGAGEDCIRFRGGLDLEDKPCTDPQFYVCECDAFAPR